MLSKVSRCLLSLAAASILVAVSPRAGAEGGDEKPRSARSHGKRRALAEEPAGRSRGGAAQLPAEHAESVGSPNDGKLLGGQHIDAGHAYLRVQPPYGPGDHHWGLPIMVNMIDRAARLVAKKYPGSRLDVGDLSQKGGGDMMRHHSHESGRDADLGFYAVDAKGKQIHAHGIKFDATLRSVTHPGARFDVARNWLFIQELLTDPRARVSHIFVAEFLRHELIAYARPRVSRALLDRAQIVIMQPTHALPHDDHFHVRISCPRDAHSSSCVELARAAPHGPARVAKKGAALKTPRRVAAAPAKKPALAGVVSRDPFPLPPKDEPDPRPEADDDSDGYD